LYLRYELFQPGVLLKDNGPTRQMTGQSDWVDWPIIRLSVKYRQQLPSSQV